MNAHRIGLLHYGLLVATAAVTLFFYQTRAIDVEQHNQRMDLLLQLKQTEAQLDSDVLQTTSFMLVQYDPFVAATRRVQSLSEQLLAPKLAPSGTAAAAFKDDIETYLTSLLDKLDLGERLKSTAALVRNVLHYLPIAADELTERNPDLGTQVSPLLNTLYRYNLLPSELDRRRLAEYIDSLEATTDVESSARPDLNHVLLHIRSNLRLMSELAELRENYTEVQSNAHFNQLYRTYSDLYARQTQLSENYSHVLLMISLALLGGMGIALRKIYLAQVAAGKVRDQLHDAVESLSDAFALFAPDGRLVLHNRKYVEFYPWLEDQLGPHTRLTDILRQQTEQGVVADNSTENHLAAPTVPALPCNEGRTYQEHLPDGRWYLASDSCTSAGELVCVRVDVTTSKQFETQLRKLYRALEQSPATVVITDDTGRIEYVNPKFEETTGYTAAEAIGQNPRILKSGDKSSGEYNDLWETIKAGKVWRGQFHNKRKDGEIYWEAASISPVRDEQGRITHFIAVKEDITARKRAEDQLRMNATVFETTTEGIMVTDAENRIKTVNPAFTRITGYEAEEVIGRNPSILRSGRHDQDFFLQMWDSLQQRGFWNGEIWNRRKDGNVFPEWLSIVAIGDPEKSTQEYVAVFSDITRRKQDEELIRRQANFDALTDLPNRSLLTDRLTHSLAGARREGWMVALLFIDLDHFKAVNDTLGHVVGDTLLQQVAERLRQCVRESDTVARFGGDEFVIVLDDIKDAGAAAVVAKKVVAILEKPFDLSGREAYIGASIGITLFPNDSADADTMLRNADMAMYRAKDAGRNNYQYFTTAMNEQMQERIGLEQDLRLAMERDQLVLCYQPIIDLAKGSIVGVESLLRWHHPERGTIPPSCFIPIAEEIGLIGPMGLWVLRKACAQAAAWRSDGLELRINVNISSRQLALGLTTEHIAAILAEHGLPPAALMLEITEGLVLDQDASSLEWVEALKAQGIGLAVDDFGTGYSSLSYLKRFPIDTLKIDRSFVRDIPDDCSDASLVQAIIAMADSLALEIVAEGIETPEQLEFLCRLGCHKGQGYLFSKPVPAQDIPALAKRKFDRLDFQVSSCPVVNAVARTTAQRDAVAANKN